MKIRQAWYCRECKEILKKATTCPSCGGSALVPMLKLFRHCLDMVSIVKADFIRTIKGK